MEKASEAGVDANQRHAEYSNLKVLLGTLVLLMVYFEALRAGFLFVHFSDAEAAKVSELATSFFIGLRFDLAIAVLLLIPAAIFANLPNYGLHASLKSRRLYINIFTAGLFGLTFLQFVEYEFYKEFTSRFNQVFFQYFDQPATVGSMIWYQYPVIMYTLVAAGLTAVFSLLLRAWFRRIYGSTTEVPVSRRRLKTIVVEIVIVLAIIIVGARGGVQRTPLQWGDAYFCNNDFANQLSLNGFFSLMRSYREYSNRSEIYSPWLLSMPIEEANEITRALVFEAGQTKAPGNTVAREGAAPSTRVTFEKTDKPPNVVLIIMESFSGRYVGALGATKKACTPAFDALCAEGVLFDRAFSGGTHTHQGIFCSTLGFPNLPGFEYLMHDTVSTQIFPSLPSLFHDQGYQTSFLYNGSLSWDNMYGFFRKQGVETFIGRDDFPKEYKRDKVWGISDADLFKTANATFEEASKQGPFFSVILTLSNHIPYELPQPLPFEATQGHRHDNPRMDGIRYGDWAMGQFIKEAKTLSYFDNTLFVFIGDHGIHVKPILTEIHLLAHHVPLLFYGPGLLKDRGVVFHDIAGQVDIAPSILGLLELKVPNSFWGKNVFAADYPETAYSIFKGSGNARAVAMAKDGKVIVRGSDKQWRLYNFDLGFPPSVTELPADEFKTIRDTMEHQTKAFVESALNDLLNRTLSQ